MTAFFFFLQEVAVLVSVAATWIEHGDYEGSCQHSANKHEK